MKKYPDLILIILMALTFSQDNEICEVCHDAVVWGTCVIGLSGLVLWFPKIVSWKFPGWLINSAHIIHSEEAMLATAFIFTAHFFNTFKTGSIPCG
ncbi:MAG: hypothetical protein ACE5D7_07255 [Fidelibacterota bacterium]